MATTPNRNERSKTILVVDDEAVIRYIVRVVLERAGHLVLEAFDGAEGLIVSRNFSGRIDLVISDVRMPKMNGPEMVNRIRAERPGIKVLLISAYPTESVPPDVAEDFLAKPFLPAAIEKKVQEMLARDPTSSGRKHWPQQKHPDLRVTKSQRRITTRLTALR
jgi:CheY-like chemotaxis protein